MAWEAAPCTVSFLAAPPFEFACTASRCLVLRPQYATHRSGSACSVEISRPSIALPCAATSIRYTSKRLRVQRRDFATPPRPSLWVRNVVFTRHTKAPPHGALSQELEASSFETSIRFGAPAGRLQAHEVSSEGDKLSLAAQRASFVALRSHSLRRELATAHSEFAREQRVPVRNNYTPSRIRREALTRPSQLARGAANSFRAPRANSLCSSSFSLTLRACSRRRAQASSSTELAEAPPVRGRRGGVLASRVSKVASRLSEVARRGRSSHVGAHSSVGNTAKGFAEVRARSHPRNGRTLRLGISIGSPRNTSEAAQSACHALRSPSARLGAHF
jgi:hypothetical protein